jgi:hypothetical protein
MADLPPLPEGFTLDAQQAGSPLPPLPAGFTLDGGPSPDPNANKSIPREAGNAATRGLYSIGQGFADLIHKLGGDPADVTAKTQPLYQKYMQDNAPPVPSYTDIKNGHDFALYVANALGGISPYALSAMAGGLPGAARAVLPMLVGEGAAQGGEEASQSPNATPASTATGAVLGGAESAIIPPFLRGSGGIISRGARALLGGGVYGGATSATANVPEAVATGDLSAGIPSGEQVLNGALSGALGMGAFGAGHAALGKAAGAVGRATGVTDRAPEDNANSRLQERISDVADQNGYNLRDVRYDSPDGAKKALDGTHDKLAEDIKGVWSVVKSDIDPKAVGSVDDLLGRVTSLESTIRSAKNKVKARVGDDDLRHLSDVVGHTEEGRTLVDLVRQSNSLTDLFSNGLKGGVSRYTDILNPLARSGKENSYGSSVLGSLPIAGTKLGELLALYHNPSVAVPLAAGYGIGRGIDAITGRRSTVAKFVSDNQGAPAPIDMTGARSILRDRFDAERQGQEARDRAAAEQDRLQQRETQLRTQNRLDNNPGLGGFDRAIYDKTGIRPADATPGVFELFRTGKITPQEFNAFFKSPRDLMGGNAGNHIMDMLDKMARDGQLQRDPEWKPTQAADVSANPPQVGNNPAYAAQAAGNQARVTAAMDRVAASEHSSSAKQAINDAIATIGRTNNRQHANEVRNNLVQSLATHSPEAARFAHQELDPLVKQIRHATPEAADTARLGISPQQPKPPLERLRTYSAVNDALNNTTALYTQGVRAPGVGLFEPPGKRFKTGIASKPANLRDLFPGLKGITPFLTESERGMVTKRNAQTLIKTFEELPKANEMASVAYSGRAKRGWYHNSANAIAHIFGVTDGPRFTALLAATSPQCSVETNLTNSLNIWAGWVEAGRPTDRDSIMRIMGDNVQGSKGQDSILDAWLNNSLRALQASDGDRITISGPKVSSFMQNLLHDVHEVTNDAWMANYANVDQELFASRYLKGGRDAVGPVGTEDMGYLAMSALARKASAAASKLTGETWTPAEIQETVWSWAKALYEKAGAKGETRSATDIVNQQALTHAEINSVPDFEKLFVQEAYRRILEKAGYSDEIASLGASRSPGDEGNIPGGSPFSTEGTGISPVAHLQHLARAARRLDALKSSREKP